ncbi:hypothetical protein CMV_022502 [Castanea mollissima]|uniref:Uncharacterized protein n=1 Tax=Castanea mollissima TaxID=60419 RepID=A0A8J4QRI1_9ROSI|nr:hypothetical protein CMV_022502 [Castanea mollissima]
MRSSGDSYGRPSPPDLLLCFISPLQPNFSKGIQDTEIEIASDQPSVTAVDFDAKYGEDSKSIVAPACSRGWC